MTAEREFTAFYEAEFVSVRKFAYRYLREFEEAEECAQEAFTRAYRAWPSWEAKVPAEAWLHRIAVNTAISYRRREKVRALPSLLWRLGVPPAGPDPAEQADSRILSELRRLPPKQAAAVVLRYYHGYTNREVAASLGVSERTVGQRISDALVTLRGRLGESGSF